MGEANLNAQVTFIYSKSNLISIKITFIGKKGYNFKLQLFGSYLHFFGIKIYSAIFCFITLHTIIFSVLLINGVSLHLLLLGKLFHYHN